MRRTGASTVTSPFIVSSDSKHVSIAADPYAFNNHQESYRNSWVVYVKGLLWMVLFLLPAIFALMSVESITDSMQKHQTSLNSAIQEAYTAVDAKHTGGTFGADNTTVGMLAQTGAFESQWSVAGASPYGNVLLKDLLHPTAPDTVKNASLGIFISGLALLVVNVVCWVLCLAMYGRRGRDSPKYLHPALGNAAWGRHVFTSIFITISFAFVNSSYERMFATGAVMAFVAAISVMEACACFCDSLRPFTDDFLHDKISSPTKGGRSNASTNRMFNDLMDTDQ
jgi:hypothetical protein